MLFDTHAHLTHSDFDTDRAEMIQRAWDAGVKGLVTIGTDLSTTADAMALAEKHDTIFFAGALHPTDTHKFEETMIPDFEKLSKHPKCVAIGETGLDYYWKDSPPDIQKNCFRLFAQLASATDKPLIIHNRDATHDLLQTLTELKKEFSNLRGIMHCFSGSLDDMKVSVDLDFYISLSGNITYKKSLLPEMVSQIPRDRLLIETDCPFLPPVPFRGKRNESSYVQYTARKIAECLGLEFEELGALTTANANRIFRLN